MKDSTRLRIVVASMFALSIMFLLVLSHYEARIVELERKIILLGNATEMEDRTQRGSVAAPEPAPAKKMIQVIIDKDGKEIGRIVTREE
jgi:hypothetical protein